MLSLFSGLHTRHSPTAFFLSDSFFAPREVENAGSFVFEMGFRSHGLITTGLPFKIDIRQDVNAAKRFCMCRRLPLDVGPERKKTGPSPRRSLPGSCEDDEKKTFSNVTFITVRIDEQTRNEKSGVRKKGTANEAKTIRVDEVFHF